MEGENKGGAVLKDTCKAIHDGVEKQLATQKEAIASVEEVATKRLDAHAKEIKSLEKVSAEVAAAQTQVAALLEMQDKRLRTIEEAIIGRKRWYETDIGKWCIKAFVVTAILVLAAAIGKPFLDALTHVKEVIPK